MALPVVEVLNLNDPEAIREFEECFYAAFIEISNPAIRSLWIWDDEKKRLRTHIPYSEQRIYFVRDRHGVMKTACAFNIGEKDFQSKAYDFPWPPRTEKWIEILTLFSGAGSINKVFILEAARVELGARGFNACYATSSEKVVSLYTRLGATLVDQKVCDGQVRILIRRGFETPFI